jgi:hypothetical protein
MSFFARIIVALRYRAKVMAVVAFIEASVPDDYPGTKKLDMALKALIKWDAKIEGLLPEVTELITGAKLVYNEVVAADIPAP